MLEFNHGKSNFWLALGLDKDFTVNLINKISDFTKLYMTEKKFAASFSSTPLSYQTKFILKDVFSLTEEDMKDGAKMFLAGHLLGAFQLTQKIGNTITKEDRLTDMKDKIVKKMDQDFEDF